MTSLPKIVFARGMAARSRPTFNQGRKAATKAARCTECGAATVCRWCGSRRNYVFDGPGRGRSGCPDLFEGRRQLIVYHFMFAPGVGGWPTAGVSGCCSMVVDHIGPLEHLHARNTSLVLVSLGPLAALEAYRQRMGLEGAVGFLRRGTSFNKDFGPEHGGRRDLRPELFSCATATRFYRTYFTNQRGDRDGGQQFSPCSTGRRSGGRKRGKDSPSGWPQTAPYEWWERHDEY